MSRPELTNNDGSTPFIGPPKTSYRDHIHDPRLRMNFKREDCLRSEIDHYADLATIVNPNNESLRVIYDGSGGDLITSTVGINSDINVYIDFLADIKRIRSEAKKLGIDNVDVAGGKTEKSIRYFYHHPNDTEQTAQRIRQIHFYQTDFTSFYPPEFTEGHDISIARGNGPYPDGHATQMMRLGMKMAIGGFFVGDRPIVRFIDSRWIGYEEVENNICFPCGRARVYKKTLQIDEPLLSRLFYIDDLIDELDAHFSSEEVVQRIYELYNHCQSLPDRIRNEARLIAGANMRWIWASSSYGLRNPHEFANFLSQQYGSLFT